MEEKKDGKIDEKMDEKIEEKTEEKKFFLKLADILFRENYIKETEKMQLQKLICQKWK